MWSPTSYSGFHGDAEFGVQLKGLNNMFTGNNDGSDFGLFMELINVDGLKNKKVI